MGAFDSVPVVKGRMPTGTTTGTAARSVDTTTGGFSDIPMAADVPRTWANVPGEFLENFVPSNKQTLGVLEKLIYLLFKYFKYILIN